MGVESDFIPEVDLYTCPFEDLCELPKHKFLCQISECKMCPEYNVKVHKTRSMFYIANPSTG